MTSPIVGGAAISTNERYAFDRRGTVGGSDSGWYPDPDDTGGLRFWDGDSWSEHRARLAVPAGGPAVCSCGVAAIGRCRECTEPYCRAHISAVVVDDRPFRKQWEPWTCGNCIEDGQREIRAMQLARCDNVEQQMRRIPKLRKVRTPNGKHPNVVNLFQHPRKSTERPARYAQAYLIEYDGGPPEPTFVGLALSLDGRTVYDIGLPVMGVSKDRFGPKRSLDGFIVTNEINLEVLTEASARPTRDSWFEYAARSFLRTARHIGVLPDFTIVFDPLPTTEPDLAAEEEPTTIDVETQPDGSQLVDIDDSDGQCVEVETDTEALVQLQLLPGRQSDPPKTPALPLPHPTA